MLKDLLRTLIESVFTSKKSYISAQAFPKNADIYFHGQANSILTRAFLRQLDTVAFSYSQTIPVTKGCRVTYTFGSIPIEIWFSPSGGS